MPNPNPFRELAKRTAQEVQNYLSELTDQDLLPLDGDQTEELSVMFREELDKLNANI